MKNVFTIIKKEFARFFKDRRMVLTILLPGIMIYALYSLMGTVINNREDIPQDFKPTAYLIEVPEEYSVPISALCAVGEEQLTEEAAKQKVSAGELNAVVKYVAEQGKKAEVQIFYNSADEKSMAAFATLKSAFTQLQNPAFVINSSFDTSFDLAEEDDLVASLFSMLIPLLMFSLLASSCMAVAPEAIAGEKERGTMATMLITPIKRWQLALGKILSLTCFALLSGISSFLGVILSLPKLAGGMLAVDTLPYTAGDYLMLFGLIISLVLLIISAFSVVSCLAKSVKESGSLTAPLMILIILCGAVTMFLTTPSIGFYLIPLVGSGLAFSAIMGLTANVLGVVLSMVSNVLIAVLLTVLLGFMFRSERIMFKR